MGASARVSGRSGVSMAAATAVSSVGVSIASIDVCAHAADFSCGEPTDDAAEATRASNTTEFAKCGTSDYRHRFHRSVHIHVLVR